MIYTKYNTLSSTKHFHRIKFLQNRRFVIIKTLQTRQSQAKPLSMIFRINIKNVFFHLYK